MPGNINVSGHLPRKVKIPADLFERTVCLLENLDIEDHCPETLQLYGYVRYAFSKKKADIELRGTRDRILDSALHGSGISLESLFPDDEPPF